MIRKQLYIAPAHDRKLKVLASQRRCTEAEIVREALEQLPDPESDDVLARLEAAGLLAPRATIPDLPTGEALRALEAEFEAWLETTDANPRLGEAVIQDREESEQRLS